MGGRTGRLPGAALHHIYAELIPSVLNCARQLRDAAIAKFTANGEAREAVWRMSVCVCVPALALAISGDHCAH